MDFAQNRLRGQNLPFFMRFFGIQLFVALAAASLLVLAIGGASASHAQSGAEPGEAVGQAEQERDTAWAYDLAHELMSPFCPGSTLAACTSSQAEQVRFWMIGQAAAGATREEVIAVLQERFGDAIRPVPKAEGWGATAFAVPLGLALVGGGVVAFALRRMVGDPADDAAPGAGPGPLPDDAELARRIDAQIDA